MQRCVRAALASGLVYGAASLSPIQPPAYGMEAATFSEPAFWEQPPAQGMEAPAFWEQPPAQGMEASAFGEQLPAQGTEDPTLRTRPPAYDIEAQTSTDADVEAATFSKPAFGEQPPAQGMEDPAFGGQPPSQGVEDPASRKQPPAYDIEAASLSKPAFGEQPPAQDTEDPTLTRQPPVEVIDIPDPIVGVHHVRRPSDQLPNYGDKHVLDPYKYPNAKCLDGSSGAYYLSPGHNARSNGLKKFYIFKMGGGGCSRYRDCYDRSYSMLGSSDEKHGWLQNMDLHGLNGFPHVGMDRREEKNPLMWDWNHIVILYCDGGFFAGSNSTPTYKNGRRLYFNGADIQEAVMSDLDERYGLSQAEDLVFGGCSAGSLGTYMTVDWLRNHPSTPNGGRVAALTCSGFFLDIDEAWYTSGKAFPFWAFNVSQTVDKGCLLAHRTTPHRCFIPEINIAFIKTPSFFWESQYDQWQLHHLYKSKCQETKCATKHANHVMAAIMRAWDTKPQTGGFLSSCSHHCEDSDMGDVANIRPIDQDLPLVAFAKWYRNYFYNGNTGKRTWHHNASYPCRDCCPQGAFGSRHTLLDGLE